MNIGSVARLLNASTSTVYRWTQAYRAFLDDSAAPSDGFARVFCERDVRVLMLVARLRNEGLAHKHIADRLQAIGSDGWEGLPEFSTDTLAPVKNVIVPADYVERQQHKTLELEQTLKELKDSTVELRREQERIQALMDNLGTVEQSLAEKNKDLFALEELIIQQRKMLQMTQVSLMADAAQRTARDKAKRRRRRFALFIPLFSVALIVAAYVFVLH